jgi:putative two-component system response regulator
VFDALTTERPYKHAWTVDEAMEHIEQQAGAHFDPRLVPLFIGLRPQLEDIRECWKD